MPTVDTRVRLADLAVDGPEQLGQIAARRIGADTVSEVNLVVSEVPYDIPALTTRGRYRVHGTVVPQPASTDGPAVEVSLFVKVVQSWAHSPFFQFVPPEFQAMALAQLPWEIEPLVYRSDLGRALPPGLRMPEAYAVLDLGPDAAAIWMEDVACVDRRWDHPDYAGAARLLGRFATSRAVADAIEPIRETVAAQNVRDYVNGRVALDVLPALRNPQLWEHPLVTRHFSPVRRELLELADQLPTLLTEVEGLPAGLCHGDACTRNLLQDGGDELVMIDFGFVRYAPLGIDLGQLILGEIQLGERPADDLAELWSVCLAAYADGVRDEGGSTTRAELARAGAICLAIFAGVSAIPVELLDGQVGSNTERIFANRAEVARFIVDLVATTSS